MHSREAKLMMKSESGEGRLNNHMGNSIGIWIDHKIATIITINEQEESIRSITSGVDPHPRIKGGSRSSSPYGVQDVVSESRVEERFRHQLHDFYQHVIRRMQDAESIYLFGPGQAKNELAGEIRKSKEMAPRIMGIQNADRMTQKQVAARVRNFYVNLARRAAL